MFSFFFRWNNCKMKKYENKKFVTWGGGEEEEEEEEEERDLINDLKRYGREGGLPEGEGFMAASPAEQDSLRLTSQPQPQS